MADASMTIMNGLLKGLVTKFDVVSSNTKDTAVEVSTLGDNLIDAIMDSSESISKKAAVVQKKSDAKIIESNNSKEQAEKDNVNITSTNNELQDLKSEKQNSLLESIRDKTSMAGKASSDLKSSIKSDFNSLTAPLQMIATTPGLKTIIQLLKTLSAFFFTAFKNMILDRFAKQITAGATGKDGKIDRKKQGQNVIDKFTPNFLRSDDQKKRRAKVMGTAIPGKPDLKKMVPGMTGKQKASLVANRAPNDPRNKGYTIGKGKASGLQKITKGLGSVLKMMTGLFSMVLRILILPLTMLVSVVMTVGSAIVGLIAGIGAIPLMIIAAVTLIAVGLFFLAKKVSDNWDYVKERFNIGIAQFGIYADQVGAFLKNGAKSLWLNVKSFWAVIVGGIQQAVNNIIDNINKIPGLNIAKRTFADGMAEEVEAERKDFEIKKVQGSEDLAQRQKDLDDRSAVLNTPAATGNSSVTSVSNVVNNDSKLSVVPESTSPAEPYASRLAFALDQ